MPRARIPVVGGPHDGLMALRGSGAFAWVCARGRATPERRDGTVLYRNLEDRYAYAGHQTFVCPNCHVYHGSAEGGREKPESCQLCGEALRRT